GEHRQDSVRRGLDQVDAGAQFVAVHDGARPLIRPAEIERVYGAAKQHGAAAAGAPVVDTLKRADEQLLVIGGVERERLFAMQTPQIFARSVLEKACAHVAAIGLMVTDEVSAAELIGQKVAIVPNDQWNLKITYPGDLRIAEFLLSQHRNA
ncbi:MAG TPA: 2-C-methyl-D-erythritol 4-phosphate cytidylyltransferase, partial [Casimicrobiaceae bacterium]|nr:2-C-methyl-D-erythritol 4-phosphate cytidylyltransferase [Casimicrobiaceae bacterium]